MRGMATWAGAILLVTGCQGSDDGSVTGSYDPENPDTWPFLELVDQALDDAHNAKVDPRQIEALEVAREQGEVTFEQYQQAYALTEECMEEAGLVIGERWEYNSRGIRILTGTFSTPEGMDPDVGFSLYEACHLQHQNFLTMVYAYQPASRDAFLDVIDERQAGLRQCLVDVGYSDAKDMTLSELRFALMEQSLNNGRSGDPEGRDCLLESGISM